MKKLAILVVLLVAVGLVTASDNPNTPSQLVACNLVDNALARIPHGNGDGSVQDSELGPGGWRFSGRGESFVTFAYTLNDAEDGYHVVAGRSNVSGNRGIINDYPAVLDLPQSPESGVEVFNGNHGEIVLEGGDEFQLPGADTGQVRINISDADGNGIFVGCAMSFQLTNFGFSITEGGDFVEREYFKAYAETDANGRVTFYEWTEVSTFNNTTSGN